MIKSKILLLSSFASTQKILRLWTSLLLKKKNLIIKLIREKISFDFMSQEFVEKIKVNTKK